MWGQADKRSKQGQKQPPTRGTCGWLAGLPHSRIGITSRQQLRTVAGPGAPGRHLPSLPSVSIHPVQDVGPGQTSLTRPPQATARKGRQERERPLSTAWPSLSQTSQPPAFWKQHRRPTLSAPRPLTCQPGPALPFVTLINCSAGAAQPLPLLRQTPIKVSTMTLDLAQSYRSGGKPWKPSSGIQGVRPWPALQSHPRHALTGHRRDQTSDPSDSSNLLGLP